MADDDPQSKYEEYWKQVRDGELLTTQPFDPKYLSTQYWSEERGFYSDPIPELEPKPAMKKESFCEMLKRILDNAR